MSSTLFNSFSVTIDQTQPPLAPGNDNIVMSAMSASIDQTQPVLEPGNENTLFTFFNATLLAANLVPTYAEPVGIRTYKKR